MVVVATVCDSAVDIETQIKSAMVARVPYFEKQAEYVSLLPFSIHLFRMLDFAVRS